VRDGAQARSHVAWDLCRAAELNAAGFEDLEAVVVDVEARARGRLDEMLDRHEQAIVVADAVDVADGDVGSFNVFFDQNAVGILAQRRPEEWQ